MDRHEFRQWLSEQPPVTYTTLLALWVIHSVHVVTGWLPASTFALSSVTRVSQSYRLFTGPHLHADAMHLSLNSLALVSIGTRLERDTLGSVLYLIVQSSCTFLASCMYVVLTLLLDKVEWSGDDETMNQLTVGFSGCLFALAVIEVETAQDAQSHVDLFGRFKVPKRLLPWLMLFAIQLLVPNSSFLGHLAGATVGFSYSKGLGLWLPRRPRLEQLEAMGCTSFWERLTCRSIAKSWNGSNTNPFETSYRRPCACCGSLLELGQSETSDSNPSFPTQGGRRLGSV